MRIKAKPEVNDHVLDEFDHRWLTPNKIYEVIGISPRYFRIIDEEGEPYLYPKYLFEIIDKEIPSSWTWRQSEEGEHYINPPELSRRGFYEHYFDHKPEACSIFENFLISQGIRKDKKKN